ncbi:MAG: DUF2062 domain-containing protein [Desulfovibrio sp.]
MAKYKYGFFVRMKRAVKLMYLRVMRLNATPHSVALGVACGVFGGCLPVVPVIPLQTLVGIALAFLLGGNKVAAAISTWVSNPLNWLLFYYAQYKIGSFLLPFDLGLNLMEIEAEQLVNAGWQAVVVMMTGGIAIGIPCALLTYFPVRYMVRQYRIRKAMRLGRK